MGITFHLTVALIVMSSAMRNFYDTLPSKYKDKGIEYDNFPKVHIKLPVNIVVVGGTGSGKTNFLMNFISETNAFTRFYICAKTIDESFYRYLIDKLNDLGKKLKTQIVWATTTISEIVPHLESMDKKESNLFICDDQVEEKASELQKVSQFWIRCRKLNCTSLFITQSYYSTPKDLRINSRVIVLVRVDQKRDLQMIIKDNSLDLNEDEMMALYNYAVRDGFPNVFMLDLANPDKEYRFRQNFIPINVNQVLNRPDGLDGEVDRLAKPLVKKRKVPAPVTRGGVVAHNDWDEKAYDLMNQYK